jgi:glycosyltransferase involved in cell wall biosynthesis
MAVKNAQETVVRAVDAALAQNFKDFELIIVDDGSFDDTADICDDFAQKDERVKVLRQGAAGPCAARNKGVSKAKGEFITFLAPDVFLLPEMYETMLAKAQDENADVVQCGYFYITEEIFENNVPASQGEVTGYNKRVWQYDGPTDTRDYLVHLLHSEECDICNLLIAKAICKATPFAESFYFDYLYNVDIALKAKNIHAMSDCFYLHINDKKQAIEVTPAQVLDNIMFLQRVFKALEKFEDVDAQKTYIYDNVMKQAETLKDGDFGQGSIEIAQSLKRTMRFLQDNNEYLTKL